MGRGEDTQLRLVTDHAPVLLAHCDRDRRYKFVNRPYAERFGLTPEQIVGKRIADVVGEQAYSSLQPHVDAVLSGKRVEFEVCLPYNRIGPRVMHCTYAPELGADGDVIGLIAAILDVTVRDHAQQALRKVEDFNRQILESSRDCIKVLDLQGRVVYINSEGRTELEISSLESVLNKRWPDFWHDADREAAERAVAAAAAGGTGHMEGYCPTTNGKPKWWDVVVSPIPGADGQPERLLVISRDITERMRFEAQLSHREQHLRAVIDTTPECVKVVARDGTLLELNAAGVQTLEADRVEDLIGRCAFDIIAPEFRDGYVAFHNRVCAGEGGMLEFDIVGLRGTRRTMEAHAVPLKGADGDVMLLAITRDVTARKAAESALEENARQKDEFIAVLAHELRNPLAPLRTALELLRLAPADAEILERSHAVMDRQVSQLVRLVDDLLDVSRFTRGKISLRRELVPLDAIVHNAIETSRPVIEAGGHRLTVTLPDAPVLLDADPTRLAQVFSNLLNNAAKYTERGGAIQLTAECQGGAIAVRLRDSGLGIPTEMLSQIFEMFTQGDRSLEKTHGGLGIGLTLAKRLVELHGGTIHASSDGPGRGSEFIVSLPIVVSPATHDESVRAMTPSMPMARRRILVVDDNRDAADCLALALQLQRHVVQTAYDGHQAVEAAVTFRPDVVLLDIGMPRMNGLEAARHIRERLEPARPLFIALTGWGQDEDRRRSRAAGFDHHLVKPVDADVLQTILIQLSEPTA